MKIYSIIFIFLNFCSFSQVDSIFLVYGLNHKLLLNDSLIKRINNALSKKQMHLNFDFLVFRNIYEDVFYLEYKFVKVICEDTTCKAGIEYSYNVKKIISNDTDIYLSYITPENKKYISSNKNKITAITAKYNKIYNTSFASKKLIGYGCIYSTNLGLGSDNISDELRKVIADIKKTNYSYILVLLKSLYPEEKLYGLLGVEILKQKNKKIPLEILKYNDLSKNTLGMAYWSEGDQSSLEGVQKLISKQPDIAKEIIRLYDIK